MPWPSEDNRSLGWLSVRVCYVRGANAQRPSTTKGSHPPVSSIKERVLAESSIFQSQASNLQSTVSSKLDSVNPSAAHRHTIPTCPTRLPLILLVSRSPSRNEAEILTWDFLANGSSSNSTANGYAKLDYKGSSNGQTTKSSYTAGSFAGLSSRTGLDRFVNEPSYVSAWSAVGAASSKKG